MRRLAAVALAAFAFASGVASGASPAAPSTVVSRHTVRLANGETLAYTATAGTLEIRDDRDHPAAELFYVAYTTGDRHRPVTFLYNGGPGSAALWLNIGAFGPRRIVMSAEGTPLAPYRVENNPETLLDVSDLVFIDPPGTGYSMAAGDATGREFWGVDEDLRAFSQFIRRWLTLNGRPASPVFLLGESYGTFRTAGLVDRLQHDGVNCAGVILLSTLLDFADDFGQPGDDNLPDVFALPTEAAIAWYHKKVPDPPADLETFLAEAQLFTTNEYMPALLRTAPLDPDAAGHLAERLHTFTGLDPAVIVREHDRVSPARFESELLRADGQVVGRYDGRLAGNALDRHAGTPQSDPAYDAVAPGFTAAFTAYAENELGWHGGRYRALNGDAVAGWNFRRAGFYGRVLAPSVIADLRDAMRANPNLRLFSAGGWFDLATPYTMSEYELANVGLDPDVRARMTVVSYPAGHMLYLRDEALRMLRADLSVFYASAAPAAH